MTYHLVEVAFEIALVTSPIAVGELSLAVHLSITETSLVFVTMRPSEVALALFHIPVELATVGRSICEHGETFSMLLVA